MTGAGASDVGARVEQLVAAFPDARDRSRAEELVRLVVGVYGEGLERVAAELSRRDPKMLADLAEDDLVGGLLLVHGLHPLEVDARIQQALDRVRPYLGSHAGGVEYLGVDEDGVAHLRLAGTCNGCPSSTVTVRSAIEGAIEQAAPEVAAIDVEGVIAPSSPSEPQLLQIGRPPQQATAADGGTAWTDLPPLGPPTNRPTVLELDGSRIVVCAVRGTLYAYRDACAVCDASLREARQDAGLLTCPQCAAVYDLRLAGRAVADGTHHLDPLPLISDSHGTRVAVPRTVAP
ncbi:MAG TPA: NifU family protein [Actinocrinis sp.]|jgi:Fe-S cluster biogenesis protein NfuA/nitrite reductase/ring-hydroxylating ferredoxin subunit|uniref:NifU family protein n=1 Tax=Actinocrinis sp. TaxID=1920516 RepID=UPI002DDD15E7|nr:NifU family protein [Actinocrinis sp.]HEV3172856.1 NifU family protein [Actinocrinis sp.]